MLLDRGTTEGSRNLRGGMLPWRRTVLSLLAAALLAVPALASLQDGGDEAVDIRRLRFEYRCFFEVEGWKGQAEKKFIDDRLQPQRAVYVARAEDALPWDSGRTFTDALPELDSLLARALLARGKAFEAADDLEAASVIATAITRLGDRGEGVAEARKWATHIVVSYRLKQGLDAVAAGNDTLALRHLKEVVGADDADAVGRAVDAIVGIVKRANNYDEIVDENDFSKQGKALVVMFQQLEQHIGTELLAGPYDSIRTLKDDQELIRKSTTRVTASMLDVAGDLAGVKGAKSAVDAASARVVWQPLGDGKYVERRRVLTDDVLWRGTYDVQVFVDGIDDPVAVFARVTLGDQVVSLGIPNQVPAGMVYVGPFPGGGGFFIDRTEVTVGAVKAVAAGNAVLDEVVFESNPDSDTAPAWFFGEDAAVEFARVVGKSIPTEAQWKQAARGPYQPGERPYPWGTASPDPGTHLLLGAEPETVGQRPAGASPYGVHDMAGSAAEWIDRGGSLWVIGGHWATEPADYGSTGKNRLWEPTPGKKAYGAMTSVEEKNEYQPFVGFIEEDASGAGLRLVVPVGR